MGRGVNEVSIVRWPDEHVGPWEVVLERTPVNGRMTVVGLTIRGVDGRTPVTATAIRSVPVARLEQLVARASTKNQLAGSPSGASRRGVRPWWEVP